MIPSGEPHVRLRRHPNHSLRQSSGSRRVPIETSGVVGKPKGPRTKTYACHRSVLQDAEEDGPDPSRYPIVLGITLTVL